MKSFKELTSSLTSEAETSHNEEVSPMIKAPKTGAEFGKKEDAFVHVKKHGGKVMKKTSIDSRSGKSFVSYVVKEEVELDETAFSDKQIKMAYGVLNDPRYKSGNLTGAVSTIEKIAKGLSKHPGVTRAMKATSEELGESDLDEARRTMAATGQYKDPETGLVVNTYPQDPKITKYKPKPTGGSQVYKSTIAKRFDKGSSVFAMKTAESVEHKLQQGDTMSTMEQYLVAIEGNTDFRGGLEEKKLTSAELKKREEVAQAIERDNPDMPMDKKMAIATSTAKKVAEETEHKVGDSVTVNSKFFGKQKGTVTKIDKQSIHVQRDGKKFAEKYPHDAIVKEEVDQIDELKTSTLTRYGTKAMQSLGRNPEKTDKRIKGIQTARSKVQQKNVKKEDAEHIDEVSKETLGSYIKKATDSVSDKSYSSGEKKLGDPRGMKLDKEVEKRRANIGKAVNRLTKEELELDEVKMSPQQQNDYDRYRVGAMSRKDYDAKYKKPRKSDIEMMHRKRKTNEDLDESALTESHFKVGDKVKCIDSGMSGTVVRLDKDHGGDDEKYYNVQRSDGKMVKYAPDELEMMSEAKEHTVPKTAKEKELAKMAPPYDKITHADVMVGRGVKKEEMSSKEKMKRGLYNKEETDLDEEQLDELSKDTVKNYMGAATASRTKASQIRKGAIRRNMDPEADESEIDANHKDYMSMSKVMGKRASGMKKALSRLNKEETDLDEANHMQMANDIEAYAKKSGGIDKNDMMKVASMVKRGDMKGAEKYTMRLDSDPRDFLLSKMGFDEDMTEAMISYSDFMDKIKMHRKAGNKIVDDKYKDGKAIYTTINSDGHGRKVTHTHTGQKVENLGKIQGDDDEADVKSSTTEKRGRGRPAGSKSGVSKYNK